jgi:VanZ family protein
VLDLLLRKTAHFVVYALLALSFLRAICRGRAVLSPKPFAVALLGSVLYAASDEVHQAFVPGRVGMWEDVLLDGAAALAALAAAGLLLAGKRLDERIAQRTSPPKSAS